jgi:hypothetical protein
LMTTLLPRADGTMTESNRLAYNALLTSSSWRAANGIYGVIDFADQAIMGNPANLLANNGGNTTYYNTDNIHYTQFEWHSISANYTIHASGIIAWIIQLTPANDERDGQDE